MHVCPPAVPRAGDAVPSTPPTSASGGLVALDTGSGSIRIAVAGGTMVEEPSVVAVDRGAPVAAGWRALDVARDGSGEVALVHPICGGAPARPELFAELIRQVAARASIGGPCGTVAVSMPAWLGPREWSDLLSCVRSALPTDDVAAVVAPVAAALGAQLVPPDGDPRVVVDVGHHLTEAGVVADGTVLAARSEWTGGADAKATFAGHLRSSHVLEPGADSLERALRSTTDPMYGRVAVRGIDGGTGRHRSLTVPAAEVACVLTPLFDQVAQVVGDVLDAVPPTIAEAARAASILLTGGMATVHGLRGQIEHVVGCDVVVVGAPTRSVVRGLLRTPAPHRR